MRGTRLQPGHAKEILVVAVILIVVARRWQRDGHPQLGLIGPSELGTHHANDLIGTLVENDGAANDRGVASEALLPCLVRQHRNQAGAGLVFFGGKYSTKRGPYFEHVEILRRHLRAVQEFGVRVVTAEVERGSVHYSCGRKDVFPIGRIAEVGRGDGNVAEVGESTVLRPQRDKISGIRYPAGIQQYGVGHREHGNVGANAEREREHRHDGEARRLGQLADCVAKLVR